MADEPNFLDLAALSKITPDLVVEKFGGRINSSFFDGSNILGGLRLKNLIDFTANFPGQSVITITDTGKQLLKEASDKAAMPFDSIDLSILQQLQTGKRSYVDIGNAVNLRPKDLALRLYKLDQQQYAVYEIKNGVLDIMLTEKGLMQAKAGMPMAAQPGQEMQMQQPMEQVQMQQPMEQVEAAQMQMDPTQQMESFEQIQKRARGSNRMKYYKAIAVLMTFIGAVLFVLIRKGYIVISHGGIAVVGL